MSRSAAVDRICAAVDWCDRRTVASVLQLALEIAREGFEGVHVGTLFTIGRADAVLAASRPLILDPLSGHAPEHTHIFAARLRGTLKALARLDGAFVMTEAGVVVAGCRYLEVSTAGVTLPMGLGSRHLAGASVSKALGIVAVVISASGTVRVYCEGELTAELRPDR